MVEASPELPLLTPEGLTPNLNPISVVDGAGLDRLGSFLAGLPAKEKFPSIEYDYETNMADTFWDRKPRLLAIGNKDEQHIIDLRAFAPSAEAMRQMGKYKTPEWAKPVIDVIKPVLESNAFLKVGQNLAFEYEVSSWNLGIRPWNQYSIDIAERVIWAGLHSFKDLKFYSLDAMTRRYFKKRVDKTLQTSFDLERPITLEDEVYSCLDLRLPRAIRQMQLRTLVEDNLYRVTKIENDAIGAFVDMHLAGMRIDRAAWAALIAEWSVRYRHSLEQLDTHLLPVVGRKNVPEGDLDVLFSAWKDRTVESSDELEIKAQKKATKDAAEKARLEGQRKFLETTRKAAAADARQQWQTLKTRQREAREMMDDCAGEAAINYGSNKQIRAALLKMKGFTETNLPNTEDDALKKHRTKPVIISLRDMRKHEKLIQTYGESWIREWSTKPSNEEGWLCPHDKKIHSIIHQLEAETGRTSSVKPNSQNLPHDPRVRACFVADPPDESIRISKCCQSETTYDVLTDHYQCNACGRILPYAETDAEEYVIVTTDMSGAELRIIAEDSGAPTWVEAFQKGWDVHSVGAELLYPELWPGLAAKEGDVDAGGEPLPACAYFNKDHKKCKCPGHLDLRDGNKSTNFLLAYGGGPPALAEAIDKTEAEAEALMGLHRQKNPEVWDYLEAQGRKAVQNLEARDRAGRRRKFQEPTWDKAKEKARERLYERLKKKNGNKNHDGTKFTIDQCNPTNEQIKSALRGLWGSIGRMGKNMPIQGLNATIAKLVMGCGFDKDGNGYLWHVLPKYKATLINMVHDEFVVHCPRRHAEKVLAEVKDCIKRAGAEFMSVIVMESEGRIKPYWCK